MQLRRLGKLSGILLGVVLLVAAGCEVVPPKSAVFDDSETFEKNYDVKDVLEFTEKRRSAADRSTLMETISVTPDGKVETLKMVSPADIQAFMEVVRRLNEESDPSNVGQGAPEGEGGANPSEMGADAAIPESVIGTDTRQRVNNTTGYPFRTVGRIDIGCTGTLIGKRYVLTAGHCVYNTRTDRWYSKLNFSPGQNGSSRPYGKIGWKRALSVKGWTRDHRRNYDYAMIVLKNDIGNRVGWLGYGWKSSLPKYNVNINGYPGDKPLGTMWHSFCRLQIVRTYRLYYPCDTAGGMSGSGVYVYFSSNNARTIYGIHAYGVDSTGLNGATRIRKAVFENLKRWKATY